MRVRWDSYGINVLRESEIKRKIALQQVKHQTEILSTFMPDEILNISLSKLDEIRTYIGVLLFADVSGFTPLCEKYTKTGKGGTDRLTATLNAYIGALVEIITYYGGDVLKFSGDALISQWKVPPDKRLYEVIHEVIVCGLFIQRTLGCFETEVNVKLKVKLAIACSNITFSVIGNENSRYYLAIGSAINDLKGAEHCSISGDVVVAKSAWGHVCEDNYEVTFASDGNVKVWSCIYFSNQSSLKEHYDEKSIVAEKLCAQHLEHRNRLHEQRRLFEAITDSKITESFIASLPTRQTVNDAPLRWIPQDLNPFIIGPVKTQVEEKQPMEYLTEMRQVTIQFINIIPTTFQYSKLIPMINKAYQIVYNIVSKVRGVLNKMSTFDKDCMMLVLFGLRGIGHELEAQNALKSAYLIRQALRKLSSIKSISIGVTYGLVYCGVIGHPFRREYSVIGNPVNKAARIMCAYQGKVTCDHETYKRCKLSSLYFQLQAHISLKGIQDTGHIFEYNEEFSKMKEEVTEDTDILGRKIELEIVDVILTRQGISGRTSICFKGEAKVGKTKLLRFILNKYSNLTKLIVKITLNEALQRAYYTASAIYKQLYNILATTNPDIIQHLPPELWDWDQFIQGKSNASIECLLTPENREALIGHFFRILLGGERIFFFIDNIQYIDLRSLELLEAVLQFDNVSLLCAGTFEDNLSWNIMQKLSRNNRIKIFTIPPLPSPEVACLICNFLNVKGASSKLIILIDRTCEGRPGWVQACVLKMINNAELEVKYANTNELEYVFVEDIEKDAIALVVDLSPNYLTQSDELSAAVTLDLFDSFSPCQQLIIKTAAVLGEVFTRATLIILLKYPNEIILAKAIETLFNQEIFDCGSRYVNSGGLQEKKNICVCYMEEEDYENESDLPRYAFCRILYFKSKSVRLLAYELLPLNQKKELHLRITDLLENQNNVCPACMRNNSTSVITYRRFNDLMRFCQDQKYIWTDPLEESHRMVEEYKDVIREIIRKGPQTTSSRLSEPKPKITDISKDTTWDSSSCFCLEILTKVFRDLIYHSGCAQHFGKKIFFILQYANVLFAMSEYEDCIQILNEASELCMIKTKTYVFSGNFKQLMLGRIQCLLGTVYLKLGNTSAAKNHALLSLRQYGAPMISFKYTLPHMLLDRAWVFRIGKYFDSTVFEGSPLMHLHFVHCMTLISNIYASDGCWKLAKLTAFRSVNCIRRTNPNIDTLCDVYTNAINLHILCGDMHTCKKLDRYFNLDALHYYTGGTTKELFYVASMISVLFYVKILNGKLSESIQLGYRLVSFDYNMQQHTILIQVLPALAFALLKLNRIEDTIYVTRNLLDIAHKYQFQGYIVYYAVCLGIILESNCYLEPFDNIEHFAYDYFKPIKRYSGYANNLLTNLYCSALRNNSSRAVYWKKLCSAHQSDDNKLPSLYNRLRYTECLLLEQVRSLEASKPILQSEIEETLLCLSGLKTASKNLPGIRPRYLHLQAYYYRINNNKKKASKYLKKACANARKQGDIQEECWTKLHLGSWFGNYSRNHHHTKPLNWKIARNYSSLQFCQLLYPLPIH